MAYDKATDYQEQINKENAKGANANKAILAALEAARNEKGKGEKITGFTPTYNYTTNPTTPTAGTIPTGFTGSTKATTGVSSAAQKIIDQMNANSLKWHSDPANQSSYEQANQTLAQQLASLRETDENGSLVSYTPSHNSASGQWTVAPNYKQATATDNVAGATGKQPELAGLPLGDKYGITYDQPTIQKLLDDATKSQFNLRNQQQQQSENKFYNTMIDTQGTALDTLRKAQASAVATGASRGMAAANELSSILNLQQTSVDESTLLAQTRNNLNVEEAAAYKQNASDSLTTSNSLKTAIAGLDSTKYGYDTQGYAAALSYLAALADVSSQKYSSDNTLTGVKYNADANVAAAGKTYGSSGNTYTGGTGGTTGTPTTQTADLDLKLTANSNGYTPEGQKYTISKNSDGTYTIKNFTTSDGSTGDLSVDSDEMTKIMNNGWDPNAVYDANYGTASYKYNYDATASGASTDTKNMSNDQVKAYFKKYGHYPAGWSVTTSPVYGNPYALPTTTPEYTSTPVTNNYTITGTQGQKLSVGYGNYATTWTYNSKTGMWTDSSGSSKNMNDFKSYVAKQNQAYVKALN